MNVNPTIKRLQTAINQNGLIITINRVQCYSTNNNRVITKVIVNQYTEEYDEFKDKTVKKYHELYSSFNPVDVVIFLSELYEVLKEGKYGEIDN